MKLSSSISMLSLLPLLASCGTLPLANGSASSTTASSSAAADLQNTLKQFLGLSADQQLQLAKALGSLELLDWTQQNQTASAENKQTSATALLTAKPTLISQLATSLKTQASGQRGPGGPGGQGGLPPNLDAIKTQYPELAAALESYQSLTPEERRSKMDALFQAHPEWQSVLAPPGGIGPGGPMGSPPPGMPPSGMPPSAFPQASASPASKQ